MSEAPQESTHATAVALLKQKCLRTLQAIGKLEYRSAGRDIETLRTALRAEAVTLMGAAEQVIHESESEPT